MLHVVVPVAQHFGIAQPAAVIDRGVVFAVAEDDVLPSGNGGNDPKVRLEARRKRHDRLFAKKRREFFFQFQMHLQRAV